MLSRVNDLKLSMSIICSLGLKSMVRGPIYALVFFLCRLL